MADQSIRLITVAEQADLAARRFIETGEQQQNPHDHGPDAVEWRRRYEIALLRHSTPVDSEASA